ncbi:sulfurtransferase complex subunit TusB [Orbus sturtevantii]|uniref:sulfurtransferase complex subunit TusB n=1 Tax=Orbus sturtevantii TaxID=3074109 RepID=UPI00370D85DA
MLHTVSSSNLDVDLINANDAILFWQDGVILALENNQKLITILTKTSKCYALDNDILARGLTPMIDKRIAIINMEQVIALTQHYYPQMKW